MNRSDPIGLFDSGIGGLSVAAKIREILPNEDLLYIADSAHAPYGEKTQAFLEERAIQLCEFLLEQKAKIIVVACNTATVSTIKKLRSIFQVPIIGIEPGIKPAVAISKNKKIAVLATQQTLKSHSFNQLADRFRQESTIIFQPCSGWVEQIEAGKIDSLKTQKLVESYVVPLIEEGVDTLVLGCTHYPFLTEHIKRVAGKEVEIIDTGIAVAKEVKRQLKINNLMKENIYQGKEEFRTTTEHHNSKQLMVELWENMQIVC